MTAPVASVTAELTITSFHPGVRSIGGGIAIGRDPHGALRRATLRPEVLARPPEEGEVWRFTGVVTTHPDYGDQIAASVALPLLPLGRALIRFLATNPKIKGVGWKTAERLWDALGDDLYGVLERREATRIAEVIGIELAFNILQGFGLLADDVRVFSWLDRYGVSPRTAAAAASMWGAGAIEKIQVDPYVMILLERWEQVDERALRLGLLLDDERRLLAAIEEAGSRRWRMAHTVSTRDQILSLVRRLLGRAAWAAPAAFDLAVRTGRLVPVRPGADVWQTRAPWAMERAVEEGIRDRLSRVTAPPDAKAMAAAIAAVEAEEGFHLTKRQREAVHMAVSTPISVISGGAGTGKTSIVKAVLRAGAARSGGNADGRQPFPQVALAGRAAKRIAEVTGTEAMTIHRFLQKLESGQITGGRGLLIVDESSMVDLPLVYRIFRNLPAEVDICWVGDPGQLPPIGPGLVFHSLAEADGIPRVVLDSIHRQSARSGIPQVAADIRAGIWPRLPTFDPDNPHVEGVFLARGSAEEAASSALAVWEAMVGPAPPNRDPSALARLHEADVQILCPRRLGPAGARVLSDDIERCWMGSQVPIRNWGLAAGSKVLWIKNDYGRPTGLLNEDGEEILATLMNGTLGVIRAPTERGAMVSWDDGQDLEIDDHDLQKLVRGWGISIHKAQGSAWQRVIIPITHSRLLDRTLIYTAITRARVSAVLVGDEDLMRAAVEAPPSALRRAVGFNPRAALPGCE